MRMGRQNDIRPSSKRGRARALVEEQAERDDDDARVAAEEVVA
jgi:hypothetical protein